MKNSYYKINERNLKFQKLKFNHQNLFNPYIIIWRPSRKSGLTTKTTETRRVQYEIIQKKNWRPPSLNGLNLIIFNMELTHLNLEASNYLKISITLFKNTIFIPIVLINSDFFQTCH